MPARLDYQLDNWPRTTAIIHLKNYSACQLVCTNSSENVFKNKHHNDSFFFLFNLCVYILYCKLTIIKCNDRTTILGGKLCTTHTELRD